MPVREPETRDYAASCVRGLIRQAGWRVGDDDQQDLVQMVCVQAYSSRRYALHKNNVARLKAGGTVVVPGNPRRHLPARRFTPADRAAYEEFSLKDIVSKFARFVWTEWTREQQRRAAFYENHAPEWLHAAGVTAPDPEAELLAKEAERQMGRLLRGFADQLTGLEVPAFEYVFRRRMTLRVARRVIGCGMNPLCAAVRRIREKAQRMDIVLPSNVRAGARTRNVDLWVKAARLGQDNLSPFPEKA